VDEKFEIEELSQYGCSGCEALMEVFRRVVRRYRQAEHERATRVAKEFSAHAVFEKENQYSLKIEKLRDQRDHAFDQLAKHQRLQHSSARC